VTCNIFPVDFSEATPEIHLRLLGRELVFQESMAKALIDLHRIRGCAFRYLAHYKGSKRAIASKGPLIRSGSGRPDDWHAKCINLCSEVTPDDMIELVMNTAMALPRNRAILERRTKRQGMSFRPDGSKIGDALCSREKCSRIGEKGA